jgi:hypothetical protein
LLLLLPLAAFIDIETLPYASGSQRAIGRRPTENSDTSAPPARRDRLPPIIEIASGKTHVTTSASSEAATEIGARGQACSAQRRDEQERQRNAAEVGEDAGRGDHSTAPRLAVKIA